MKVVYYKSAVCPRCLPVTRTLAKLQADHPELEVERVEILAHPSRTLKAGVRGIPALQVGDEVRSWFIPKRDEITQFIESHLG